MIMHAKVAKLFQYLGDPAFDRVMSHINAAQEEGLDDFELDVNKLADYMLTDLMAAMDAMEFNFELDDDAGTIRVINE